MNVRRAELKDLSALVALHEEVQQLHLAARPDQFKAPAEGALEKRFRELLASADAKVWVAELDAAVVGYAVQLLVRRPGGPVVPDRQWIEIDMIGVFAPHRGHGVGRALIDVIVDDARAAGIEQVELSSWAFNTDAHQAFERAGFVPKLTRFELKRTRR
ncbi:MAG TPA: GNAT family N-acetyltransferase [Polyangiaceae bacterium]|nr:GNAT family N-acetyltransferase [Polyangiaceae bacterium]